MTSSQTIDISKSSQPEQLPAQAKVTALSAFKTRTAVILATCKVLVVSPNMKTYTTRPLIDPGSELTLVSAKLVKDAKLNHLAAVIPILGVGNQSPNEPLAIHTIFGWAFLGPASSQARNHPLRSLHTVTNDELQDSLTKFWVQKEVPDQIKPSLSLAEAQCEDYYTSTLSRNQEGRYVVRIPLSAEISQLGDSRAIAYRCLKRLLKHLDSDELLKQRYMDFMQEYETLGHMVAVPNDAPEPQYPYYLPHHGVLREQSTSTKLRVVFNGSCKTTSQVSLNDIQHTGPKTQRDIIDFIRKIGTCNEFFGSTSSVQAYQLTTVTYGTQSAPYLACRTLKRLVEDERENYPLAVDAILKGSYVDDISGGADTIELLNEIA
ncbi:uncharacterized protein LOC141530304 [Cotesia typhae]|uniref:uncharacterized protein LOC141530304 n=1 Tax=Cotesia typhae TaxID=2053667 RepID=UPI003D693876